MPKVRIPPANAEYPGTRITLRPDKGPDCLVGKKDVTELAQSYCPCIRCNTTVILEAGGEYEVTDTQLAALCGIGNVDEKGRKYSKDYPELNVEVL